MSSTAKQEIITVPPNALETADWLGKRETLLAEARCIEVVDSDEALEVAGAAQTAISKHIKAMASERLALTRQIDAVKKDIMAQERALVADLDAELARLKRLNNAYATEVARRAAEERERREAEEHRRRMEEAERQAKAQAMFGEDAAVAPAPEPVMPPPPPEKVSTSSNRMVRRWKWALRNAEKVPREFLSVDSQKVNAHVAYCQKMDKAPIIDGIDFEAYMSVESR